MKKYVVIVDEKGHDAYFASGNDFKHAVERALKKNRMYFGIDAIDIALEKTDYKKYVDHIDEDNIDEILCSDKYAELREQIVSHMVEDIKQIMTIYDVDKEIDEFEKFESNKCNNT